MCLLLKQPHSLKKTVISYYSHLEDLCLRSKSRAFTKSIHAQLIKVGLISHTFLVNRCLDLYAGVGSSEDVLGVFSEIPLKNQISWNICLKGLQKCGCRNRARQLFDKMPVRDVVSWNSMISGYASVGMTQSAVELFLEMQNSGLRPNEYAYSISMSLASCDIHARQIHGSIITNQAIASNMVLGNSLIGMYSKLGMVDDALTVFDTMNSLDIISWNSLISGFLDSGYLFLALDRFHQMMRLGFTPNEITISLVMKGCCDLRDLQKGKQIFLLSMKMGFVSNSIIASAAIDLFSKCNRLVDSIQIFEEFNPLDIPLCNSMISSLISHGESEAALHLFIKSLRSNLNPTEYTLSSILSAVLTVPSELGSEIHSLIIKSGFQSELVVASSLSEMYIRIGMVVPALEIFLNTCVKDLISWNTVIIGLARNGGEDEALKLFQTLIHRGIKPDRITVFGALLACCNGGLLHQGMFLFSSMNEQYGVIPEKQHYSCIINLVSHSGKTEQLLDIIQKMPCFPSFDIFQTLLKSCIMYCDTDFLQEIEDTLVNLYPKTILPYQDLVREYERRQSWEDVVKIRHLMRIRGIEDIVGSSWINLKGRVFSFKEDDLQHHGGTDIYAVLRLLNLNEEQ